MARTGRREPLGPSKGGRRQQRKPRAAPQPYTKVPESKPVEQKTVEQEPIVIVPDTPIAEAREGLKPSIFYGRAVISSPKISVRNYRPDWML